jgi:CubicO group peptidase (beta-lactamase class C family)
MLISCLKEDELKNPFVTFKPKWLNDGWDISDPLQENVDPSALEKIFRDFHADEETWQVRSLLVFRNGKLIAESYTKDTNDIKTPRAIWSATKQVVGILTGIAIERNLLQGVQDPVSLYLPQMKNHSDKQNILIEDLLTMKSGISYSNDGLSGQTDDILRQKPDSLVEFILSRPLQDEPGFVCSYKDCDPQLVAAVLEHQCNSPLPEWAGNVLFNPLGIENLEWDRYRDGTTLGGFGILTTPRELAKFGQVVLDSGKWKGMTIVSKEWISQMTAERIPDLYTYQFGYLWWREKTRNAIFMSGHGGQFAILIPEKRLLIVMTAEVNTQGDFQFREPFDWVDRIVSICH